ncbi:alpha/beta fold hydrolase [Antribacter gilvus]|uniref:alpha/beta fold hydrolase n=1 Tax=Antribacter gilvus TaxID=2304675 RepID=UPI000F76B970|nr:alpha/beta hydrolase [Antribacter gilvus]
MEHLLSVPGAVLCASTCGDPRDPALLLIGGAASSLDGWDDALCAALAAGGRYVIRYDHRDTGRSSTGAPGKPTYTGDDLALDALRVLDGLEIERAHLMGVSMGGAIAQTLALEHPERVLTLTLVATSPVVATGHDLPGPDPVVQAVFADPPPDPDWADDEAVAWYLAEAERPFQGAGYDPVRALKIARQTVARSHDPAAAANHWQVSGTETTGSLANLAAPTLVLHGTADPLFPPDHGRALAEAIPDARLVLLDRMGHQVPPPETWPQVVREVLAHTAR